LQQPTILHFHGLHVSLRGNGDNVFLHVGPGESFQYRIPIPHDHDSGLYWFHTHAHGFVSQQIIAGLSGAIIVEGITRRYPMLRGMKERVISSPDARILRRSTEPREQERCATTSNISASS